MSEINPHVAAFRQEAEELLEQIEEIALELGQAPENSELVHQLFRAFHTIKGSGSMFGFDSVAEFTHHVESALDQARDGRASMSREVVDLVLAAKDQIQQLLGLADPPPDIDPPAVQAELVRRLQALFGGTETAPALESAGSDSPTAPSAAGRRSLFHIRFRPDPAIFLTGNNPLLLLNEVRALGQCIVQAATTAIPRLEELQPDRCFWTWELELTTTADANAIKDVFIFVDGNCELDLSSPTEIDGSGIAAPTQSQDSAGTANAQLSTSRSSHPETGKSAASTVRVPAERLDRLVRLVGEMVTVQSRLTQVSSQIGSGELDVPVEEIERLVSELRENVLGIRMMPIGTTFSRFKRLVHDLSVELGKEIDLRTEGAETELDKTVLDRLADPLVHLLRNCIDHGIEAPEVRCRAGKSARGLIRLRAAHVGSTVVLTIRDDGRGLDAEKIRARAVEKNLIGADAAMSPHEAVNLLFLPGFSTAEQVTGISGRGVGMDAVKRQIEALRGTVEMASQPGQGTSVTVTLPLTLAIIDGLLVEVASDRYILPLDAVMENVELNRDDRRPGRGSRPLTVRGELVPCLRLRDLFAIRDTEVPIERAVIVRHGAHRFGLGVDRVLGSHQTVIQALGRFYRNADAFSGTTILGDGSVALILNINGLFGLARQAQFQNQQQHNPPLQAA